MRQPNKNDKYLQNFIHYLCEIIIPDNEKHFKYTKLSEISYIYSLHKAGVLVYYNQVYGQTDVSRTKSATTLITRDNYIDIFDKLKNGGVEFYCYQGEEPEYHQIDYVVEEEYKEGKSGKPLAYLQYSRTKFHSEIERKELYMIDLTTKNWEDINLLQVLDEEIRSHYTNLRNSRLQNQSRCIEVFCYIRQREGNDLQYSYRKNPDPKYSGEILKIDQKQYEVSKVFGPKHLFSDILEEIEPLIISFLNGHDSCCILALGQSGTGKTFLLDEIYEHLKEILQKEVTEISSSYIQIYNNKVYDLFSSKQDPIVDDWGQLFHKFEWEEFKATYIKAYKKRKVQETDQNFESSRSHSVLRLSLCHKTTTFTLIDLAGDEKMKTSENPEETASINLDLFNFKNDLTKIARGSNIDNVLGSRNVRKLSAYVIPLLQTAKDYFFLLISPYEIHRYQTELLLKYMGQIKDIQFKPENSKPKSKNITKKSR